MKSKLLNLKFNKNFKFHPFEKLRTRISNFRKGFTLIELLIVIAIIGVLATILLVNFMGVRQRSRDAQRKADLRQIQSAIELYKADQGVYPPIPLYSANCPTSSPLVRGTVTYMKKIPCDPSSISFVGNPPGNYFYDLNGTYYLAACIENTNDKDPNNRVTRIDVCPSGKKYVPINP